MSRRLKFSPPVAPFPVIGFGEIEDGGTQVRVESGSKPVDISCSGDASMNTKNREVTRQLEAKKTTPCLRPESRCNVLGGEAFWCCVFNAVSRVI